MKKLMVFLLSLVIFFLFGGLVSGSVLINEVMYNPKQCSDDYCEYIEIYNNGTTEINLANWKIKDMGNPKEINFSYSNTTNIGAGEYFIIAKNPENLSQHFNISCHLAKFSISLNNDGGDNISILDSNNNIIDFINYSNSWGANGNGKSLQFCNNSWIEASPTPGSENNCLSSAQVCIQNWSCSAWGSCTNEIQKRTCTDLNNCSNVTGKPAESKTCNQNTSEIYLELDWNEDDIVNGEEFDITVEAFNLKNENYDIKVYITPEDDSTIISETYNEKDDKWKSSTYYVESIISGSGDKSATLSLRIKSSYRNFSGDAEVTARIRKSEPKNSPAIDEVKEDIEILGNEEESDNKNNTSKTQEISETTKEIEEDTAQITSSVIKLGNRKAEINNKDVILYESSSEKIKKYSIYGLNLILIVILIFLIRKKRF